MKITVVLKFYADVDGFSLVTYDEVLGWRIFGMVLRHVTLVNVSWTAALEHAMSVELQGIVYLSSTEVLSELQISRQTLWRWRQNGKVPSGNRFRDGRLLFSLHEVNQIREFAHRIEPAEVGDNSQLQLFDGSELSITRGANEGSDRG